MKREQLSMKREISICFIHSAKYSTMMFIDQVHYWYIENIKKLRIK